MLIAKVVGTMNATLKHPAFEGRKILLVQPLTDDLREKGEVFLAVDTVQAGVGATVLVAREGGSARIAAGDESSPIHAAILGIVDMVGDQPVP
ncbi:MAG: EutN/CcmL family microcompartment protein [Candidatus Sericytochromatia bacterium]|nr:EutN/CcmL family microcompartment protein [Candidatus Tanganyikabacteria bacterium]